MAGSSILTATGNDQPSMKDLSNFAVPKVGASWYKLGVQLLEQQYVSTLHSIKADHKNSDDSCIEMFYEWLTTDGDASWNKLIDGLKSPSVKLNSLANKLQKMLQHDKVAKKTSRFGRILPRKKSNLDIHEVHGTNVTPNYHHLSQVKRPGDTFPKMKMSYSTQTLNHYECYGEYSSDENSETDNDEEILQPLTPKTRQKKPSSPAISFTTEKQQSNPVSLQMSPKASHTDDCTTYQQQHESKNDAANFQTTENSSKEQQHKSTLNEENTRILKNSLKEKQQLESSLTEQNTIIYQALENSLKESIILHLENLFMKRFTHLQQQLDSLKEQKSMDSHSEVDTYKMQTETEKRKAQETLQQVSTEKEEILKQLSDLEKSYHKLEENNQELLNQKQSLENQLEDVLKQMDIDKKEFETLIKDNKHEIETLKLQIETEKVKTIETQEVLMQTSTEKEEKTKQILTLEENNLKLLNEKQSIEKQLEDVLKQMDIDKKEYEANIKDYQHEAENEKVKTVNTQEILIQMSTEREEKIKQILTLEENNYELLNQKQSLEKQLEDVLKQMDIVKKEYETLIKDNRHEVETLKLQFETEKVKNIKTQEDLTQMSTEREEKTKQILTLEENNFKLLNQKQSLEKQLEDVLKQVDINKKEYETHIKDYQHEVETEKVKAVKAQETLTQVTDENEEKAKQILALQKNNHELLCQKQNIEKQMEDVLKQRKREYEPLIKDNENEEAYKIQMESEKEKVLKAQEVLAQVSAELQEKAKEIIDLNENQHKLKSTVEKLEDALTKSNVEHKITEYIKEIQQYKMLNDTEKENAGKAQEVLIQVSAELQTKAKEILVLEQNLLHEKQSAEKQMQDILEQCDARIKEMEDLNKSLQDEKEKTSEKLLQSFTEITNAREIQSTLQNENLSLLQEKENLKSDIKRLQDENNTLKVASKELDRQKLQQKEKLRELSPLDTKDESDDRSSTLSSEESFKECLDDVADLTLITTAVKDEITKKSTEHVKDELVEPHAELSVVDQFLVQNPLTEIPGSNQLTTMKKAIVKDQSRENTIKDHITETPTSCQLTEATEKDQLAQTPTVHQTPEKDQFIETLGNDHPIEVPVNTLLTESSREKQLTEDHNTELNDNAKLICKSSPSSSQALDTLSEESSVEYTPFGKRIKSVRRKKHIYDEKPPTTNNAPMDDQLQELFAKRKIKISDKTSLETFEKKVKDSMSNARDAAKQTKDDKYVKEKPEDRGVDSQLFTALKRQRNKITQN